MLHLTAAVGPLLPIKILMVPKLEHIFEFSQDGKSEQTFVCHPAALSLSLSPSSHVRISGPLAVVLLFLV